MSAYDETKTELLRRPRRWLVTGVAGFIGSHLLETLLKLGQEVRGVDNFATGKERNLAHVQTRVAAEHWARLEFITGDVTDLPLCHRLCQKVDFVLHEAALGSVPLSMADPLRCHENNVTGFLNLLIAAREAEVQRVVYASSSAVYGDEPGLPKVENRIGNPLSPYAASKLMNELYAGVFARAFDFPSIGLRYFNVFGPRQDPEGPYAAVIPKWLDAFLEDQPIYINGDGESSRDFCFVEDVVQANLLAAVAAQGEALNQVYNVGLGQKTTLNQLFAVLQRLLRQTGAASSERKPLYREFRPGDVRHSLADIGKAQRLLGFAPAHQLEEGLSLALEWYRQSGSSHA